MSRPIRKFIAFSSPLLLGIPPVDHRNFSGKISSPQCDLRINTITRSASLRLAVRRNQPKSSCPRKLEHTLDATTEIAKSPAIFITRKTRSISRISPPAAIHQAWRDATCRTARSSSSCMTPGASFGPPGVTNIESNAPALGLWSYQDLFAPSNFRGNLVTLSIGFAF